MRVKRRVWISGLVLTVAAAAGLVIGNFAFPSQSQAAVSPGGTSRASVNGERDELPRDSGDPAVSADGRYVAFATRAAFSTIDAENDTGDDSADNTDFDVYVRDTVTRETLLVSHGIQITSGGGPGVRRPADGPSDQPSISADGRYIAFRTEARNIPRWVEGSKANDSRIVICDRDWNDDGTLDETCAFTLVSDEHLEDEFPRMAARLPNLSADASLVSYEVAPVPTEASRVRAGSMLDGPLAAAVDPSAAPTTGPTTSPTPTPSPSGPADDEDVAPLATDGNLGAGWVELVSLSTNAFGDLTPPQPSDHTVVDAPARLTVDGTALPLAAVALNTMAAGGGHVAFTAFYLLRTGGGDGGEPARTLMRGAVFDYVVANNDLDRLDTDADGNPLAGNDRIFMQAALSGDGRRYAFSEFSLEASREPVLHL